MSEHAVTYGQSTIRFSLEQKPRKSLKISVMPDLSVGVSAPSNYSIEKVLNKIQRRASWIVKQIDYFKGFMPKQPPRQYVSGETHYYLGRQYRLKIEQAKVQGARLQGRYLFLKSRQTKTLGLIKRIVYEWYRKRAKVVFEKLAEKCSGKLKKYGIKKPSIEIKTMKSRWGSCVHTKNKMCLNTELIKAPSHCIEYVVMHEMCHFKYPNHTKQFYKFLSLVMPDWIKRKRRLEQVVL